MFFKLEGTQIGIAQREITPFFAFNWLDFDVKNWLFWWIAVEYIWQNSRKNVANKHTCPK